ncbi:MAG: hypothetical protein AAGA29_13275 [Planctomycetota bacterium]
MKTVGRIFLVTVLCAIGCGDVGGDVATEEGEPAVMPAPEADETVQVDEVIQSVENARKVHRGQVNLARAGLEISLDDYIQEVAQMGDPVLAREALAQRDRFLQTGDLPFSVELEGAVALYERQVALAERDLAEVLREAVVALTRDLRVDEALALQDEAARLADSARAVLGNADDSPEALGEAGGLDASGVPIDPELFPGLGAVTESDTASGGADNGASGGASAEDTSHEPAGPGPIAERLAEYEVAYHAEIESARQAMLDRIDTRIAGLRSVGDLEAAGHLADEQARFREHGVLPGDPSLRPIVRRYVTDSARALHRFTRPCGEAVTAYYSSGDTQSGQALSDRLDQMRRAQAFIEAVAGTRAARSPEAVYRFETGGEVARVAVSADGLVCCAWSRHGVMHVWSLATGELISRFEAQLPGVSWLHMDQDGSVISASCWSHSGMLYRQDGTIIADLDEHRERYNMEITEDGHYVVVGGHYWTTVQSVDALENGDAPKLEQLSSRISIPARLEVVLALLGADGSQSLGDRVVYRLHR